LWARGGYEGGVEGGTTQFTKKGGKKAWKGKLLIDKQDFVKKWKSPRREKGPKMSR